MPQVVIRSKITGQCPKCPQIIQDGDPVAILLGEWMHVECKAASLAARITFTTEVPTVCTTSNRRSHSVVWVVRASLGPSGV